MGLIIRTIPPSKLSTLIKFNDVDANLIYLDDNVTTLSASFDDRIIIISSSFLKTGSVSLNTLTFTKGDGSTFSLTVDTGSGTAGTINTGSFVLTSSFNPFTESINLFTQSYYVDSASFDTRINNIPIVDTGSFVKTGSFNAFTESINNKTGSFLKTGSVSLNTLTFTKDDGTSFNLTVNTGSIPTTDTGSFLKTGSANPSNSDITFTKGDGTTFTITTANDKANLNGGNTFNGNQVITGSLSNGIGLISSGDYSHAEGINTTASGNYSHAEGQYTYAQGDNSHAEGYGSATIDEGSYLHNANGAHAEGLQTTSSGNFSHAEGDNTYAYGFASHAEGYRTQAIGNNSHAEGILTVAIGNNSRAIGQSTTSVGIASHAEGADTITSGAYSHAEGINTTAIGQASHTEGSGSIAFGDYSHAGGLYTIASGSGQTVVGKFNKQNNTDSLFIIGNGINDSNRSDLVLFNTGSVEISGSFIVNNEVLPAINTLITTSSFNSFTQSINDKTGSFVLTSSFNAFTGSVVTTSSFNTYTGSVTSALNGKANLNGGNSFTGDQTLTSGKFTINDKIVTPVLQGKANAKTDVPAGGATTPIFIYPSGAYSALVIDGYVTGRDQPEYYCLEQTRVIINLANQDDIKIKTDRYLESDIASGSYIDSGRVYVPGTFNSSSLVFSSNYDGTNVYIQLTNNCVDNSNNPLYITYRTIVRAFPAQ